VLPLQDRDSTGIVSFIPAASSSHILWSQLRRFESSTFHSNWSCWSLP